MNDLFAFAANEKHLVYFYVSFVSICGNSKLAEKKPVIHEICIAPLEAAYYSRDFQEVRLFPCTTLICLLRSSVYSTSG